jgi:hypothetical protein
MKVTRRFKIERLEARIAPSITSTTTVVKVPGPTDTLVTTATNPSGNTVPGQSDVTTISNKDAHLYR